MLGVCGRIYIIITNIQYKDLISLWKMSKEGERISTSYDQKRKPLIILKYWQYFNKAITFCEYVYTAIYKGFGNYSSRSVIFSTVKTCFSGDDDHNYRHSSTHICDPSLKACYLPQLRVHPICLTLLMHKKLQFAYQCLGHTINLA